jgi:glycine/D-amino acid oxidase-like deaminating enzyme
VHPARFTTALLDAARAKGAALRLGVVEGVTVRDGVARGVQVSGESLGADAVVLALGPWTTRAARGLRLPTVRGLKGYSVTLAAGDLPAHACFMDYRTADGRALEPEIIRGPTARSTCAGWPTCSRCRSRRRAWRSTTAACAVLARAAGQISTGLASATITRRQACYRPVTDDGLPLIGRVPGAAGAYVATGHGPWGMLNAPATGLALAELIADGAAKLVDLRAFDPGAECS